MTCPALPTPGGILLAIYLGFVPSHLYGELKPIQPLDIFEFEFVLDPQVSPNGEEIVYVRRYSDVLTDQRFSNLWLIRNDGSQHKPLTTGLHHDSSPRWSPDGPGYFMFPIMRANPRYSCGR